MQSRHQQALTDDHVLHILHMLHVLRRSFDCRPSCHGAAHCLLDDATHLTSVCHDVIQLPLRVLGRLLTALKQLARPDGLLQTAAAPK